MPKRSLRMQALASRSALSGPERSEAEKLIQSSFIGLPEYLSAGSIALYLPVRGEVATDLIVSDAMSVGKSVYLPAVRESGIEFRRYGGLRSLSEGAFGIFEPAEGAEVAGIEDIDIFVVPGVAFSLHGCRIGYGKGYYDKALHSLIGCGRLIALSFECQLFAGPVREFHDVIMDRIITERRVITPVLMK